jgi:hypothetical protein
LENVDLSGADLRDVEARLAVFLDFRAEDTLGEGADGERAG